MNHLKIVFVWYEDEDVRRRGELYCVGVLETVKAIDIT